MIAFAQVIAALLGVLCGSIMIAMLIYVPIFLKNRSFKTNPQNKTQNANNEVMPQELIHSVMALLATFIFASIAIFVYFLIAPDTLVWFGITALIWYLTGFAVYAVQKIAKERKSHEK